MSFPKLRTSRAAVAPAPTVAAAVEIGALTTRPADPNRQQVCFLTRQTFRAPVTPLLECREVHFDGETLQRYDEPLAFHPGLSGRALTEAVREHAARLGDRARLDALTAEALLVWASREEA